MRSRTVREGSVGLLIVLGLAVLGGLILWLRGFSLGNRSYQATVRFPNAEGMQVGAPVRYRGVIAGKISAIRVSANYAEVDIKITPATIVIPQNVTIEAKQSGLVGETFIDITPNAQLPENAIAGNPLSRECDDQLIICNGSYLQGTTTVTLTELLGSVIRFTNLFSSPEFFSNVQTLTRNFAQAANGVNTLAGEVTTLSKSVRGELGTLSNSAERSSDSIGAAANQIGLTAGELKGLISDNRASLVSALNNINQASAGVETIVTSLSPVLAEEGDFLTNLQTLSANAAEAAATIRNLTSAVGTADNIVLLQQTLDSARATFQNAQKITADLDELTGDPTFRENVRRLVNGLGGLVSSTQELQEQTQIAQMLSPMAASLEAAEQSARQPTREAETKSHTKRHADSKPPSASIAPTSTANPVTANPVPESTEAQPTPSAPAQPLSPAAQDLLLPNNGLRQSRESRE